MTALDPVTEREMTELFARADAEERAGFREDLRSRLLAQVGPATAARRVARPWWALPVPRPVLAGMATVALLFGVTGTAAAGSLPGEPLFELKRAAEEVALALAFDDEMRLERLADQASARVAELQRAQDGVTRAAAARESARALERLAEAQRGSSADPGSRASENADEARDHADEVLRDLAPTLPAEAAEGIRRALEAGRPEIRGPQVDATSGPANAPGRQPEASPAPSERPGNAPSVRPTPPSRSAPGRPATPGQDGR